jgi:uncharacterized membrane protein (UPF0182 family)
LLVLLLLLFLGGGQVIPLITDWLWFGEVGYRAVFATTLTAKLVTGLLFGLAFFLIVFVNLKIATRTPAMDVLVELEDHLGLPSRFVVEPFVRRFLLPGALLLGFIAGSQAAGEWSSFLSYFNATPFNLADPIFGYDLGFYAFRLPALKFLYGWLIVALGLTLVLTALTYLLYRGIHITARGPRFANQARAHLLLLLGCVLLVKAGGYLLDRFELLFSARAVAFGAGYTDVNVTLPALTLMMFLAVISAALAFYHAARGGFRSLAGALGALVLIAILGQGLIPGAIQRLRVVPNEISLERPFIERTIKFTRLAYGLDRVEEKDFPAEENLTVEALRRNDATIKNIRLWDHRPLLATYAQLQEIRTYYKFTDVDNDRYWIDGEYRQVMLSARELSYQHLPSRIWINEHLTYTHGYGVVLGPVNRISREGLPEFMIKDIPPVATSPIKVTRPEIYFGETANDYVFVKTRAQEFDYPAGDQNVFTTYQGTGGVPIGSFARRLLFAARFGSINPLIAADITAESRILFNRKIDDRVKAIAPFIKFDPDPYLVIAKDGRLFWIIDGYTTTDKFPYSEPIRRFGNYIRNSVKVVVDAYNGTMTFYLADPGDPIVQTYRKIFPALLKPLEAMPDDLRAHVRYPQQMFAIQARLFATYHMQDPQVFYNKEDLWSIPRKAEEGREVGIEPYYTIMRLPGEKREEFILLLPFTPSKRDNMIAWFAARSDGPAYGRLLAYTFPKAKLVYGPRQIDARIDQDAFISQQLSLWSQRGSVVIRGSLLAIPVEQSLLYVQPLYLAAEKGSLPELKRVIVAYGNQIAMEETLEQSLERIFGAGAARRDVVATAPAAPPAAVAAAPAARPPAADTVRDLAARAQEHYARAQEHLRQGNWAGYGEEQKRLGETLKALRERAR